MLADGTAAMETKPPQGEEPSRLGRLSGAIALLGGALAVGVGLLVSASVILRWWGLGGIPGDFELVQMLTAASVFCFLPLCQQRRGHVIVDAVSQGWRLPLRRRVDGVWEILAAGVFVLMAWQLAGGAHGMSASGTNTMVLALPVAPVVWFCALLCGFLAFVALAKGLENLRERSREG